MPRPRPDKTHVISRERFIKGLMALGYAASRAEALIGVPRRSLYQIASGQMNVPVTAARLLDMYERFGIPEEHRP